MGNQCTRLTLLKIRLLLLFSLSWVSKCNRVIKLHRMTKFPNDPLAISSNSEFVRIVGWKCSQCHFVSILSFLHQNKTETKFTANTTLFERTNNYNPTIYTQCKDGKWTKYYYQWWSLIEHWNIGNPFSMWAKCELSLCFFFFFQENNLLNSNCGQLNLIAPCCSYGVFLFSKTVHIQVCVRIESTVYSF